MLSAQPLGPLNPADCIFSRGEGLTAHPTPPTCFTVHTYGAIYILLNYHRTPNCYKDGANVMPAHVTHVYCAHPMPLNRKFGAHSTSMYYRQRANHIPMCCKHGSHLPQNNQLTNRLCNSCDWLKENILGLLSCQSMNAQHIPVSRADVPTLFEHSPVLRTSHSHVIQI
jgi:hypothetical protein